MTERSLDTTQKIDELRAAIASRDVPKLLETARHASLALEFRDSDAMIGLVPVVNELVGELAIMVAKALATAASLGSPEARTLLSQRRLGESEITAVLEVLRAQTNQDTPEGYRRSLIAAEVIFWNRLEAHATEAAQLAERARKNDPHGEASYLSGLLAFHGFGRAKNLEESYALHQHAASLGHANAMFELYAKRSQGLGCPVDEADAINWCIRAAEAGQARAMANLGGFYATGRGLPRNLAESVKWYERAAEQGHGKAAATLGVMYALGQEIPSDPVLARKWFSRAEEDGFDWRSLATAVGLDINQWEANITSAPTKAVSKAKPKSKSKPKPKSKSKSSAVKAKAKSKTSAKAKPKSNAKSKSRSKPKLKPRSKAKSGKKRR
jgi:TPR repeat protein